MKNYLTIGYLGLFMLTFSLINGVAVPATVPAKVPPVKPPYTMSYF